MRSIARSVQSFRSSFRHAADAPGTPAKLCAEVHHAVVAKHHDEETQSPCGISHAHRAVVSPVHLGELAGDEVEGEKPRRAHRTHLAYLILHDREPAVVTGLARPQRARWAPRIIANKPPPTSPSRSVGRGSRTTFREDPQPPSLVKISFHRLSLTSVLVTTALNCPPNRVNSGHHARGFRPSSMPVPCVQPDRPTVCRNGCARRSRSTTSSEFTSERLVTAAFNRLRKRAT